ncbi:hypothetical protein Tsp_08036 [Trichinella spiralis]|uniref:hypothetical protein n=1 Tax=Trichinella spiralis TaxID=6334 RepID=UPI0001EFDF0E|nr:hypothetical protein Tsp_08036 [Trichinella spiralis]
MRAVGLQQDVDGMIHTAKTCELERIPSSILKCQSQFYHFKMKIAHITTASRMRLLLFHHQRELAISESSCRLGIINLKYSEILCCQKEHQNLSNSVLNDRLHVKIVKPHLFSA